MKLGLVLGGVAQGAMDTYKMQQDQARLQQAADDAHTQALRIQQEQHNLDMITAQHDNAATAAATAQTNAGALPSSTTAASAPPPVAVAAPAAPGMAGLPIPTDASPDAGTVSPPTAAPVDQSVPPPPAPPLAERPVAIPTQAIPPQAAPAQAPPSAPTATASGPMARAIRAAGAARKVDPRVIEASVAGGMAESSLNPNVHPNGSSTGLFMFHPSTFASFGGKDITDPNQQIAAGLSSFSAADKALSQTLGRPATATEMYIGHQQNIAAAKALLTADPSKSAAQVLVDAGIYKNPDIAHRAITGNFPHAKGEKPPADPTVGQFKGAWETRINKFMGGAAVSPGAPADTTQAAAPAAPTPEFYSDDAPHVYDAPDGSGPMVTHNPRLATADTAQDQADYRRAQIYNQYGQTDKANQIYAGIQARRSNDRAQRVDSIVEAISHVTNVNDIPGVYSQLSDQMHVKAMQDSAGNVHVQYYSNANPDKMIGHDDFNSTSNMSGLDVLKNRVANQVKDVTQMQQLSDAHDRIVHDISRSDAEAYANTQSGKVNEASVAAGLPGAQASAARAGAADSQAHADALGQDTRLKAQIQQLGVEYSNAKDEASRQDIQQKIAALTGQIGPQVSQVMDNGQPTTMFTYTNGLRTTQDPKLGEIEVGQKQGVYAAMAAATKQKVPLTYGRHIDPKTGGSSMAFSIAGHPELGTSTSANDMFQAYENLGRKVGGALPSPSQADKGFAIPTMKPDGSVGQIVVGPDNDAQIKGALAASVGAF